MESGFQVVLPSPTSGAGKQMSCKPVVKGGMQKWPQWSPDLMESAGRDFINALRFSLIPNANEDEEEISSQTIIISWTISFQSHFSKTYSISKGV